MSYYRRSDDRIICELCHHHCSLKEGQYGMCGVEMNVSGALRNTTYGYPAAINIDPIEKKPLYHFLPGSKSLSIGTVGCNFRCSFCQNWQISQSHENPDSEYISPERMVQVAQDYACESISYTYNEPTVFYPYAKDIGILAKEQKIKNVFVSNGFESAKTVEDMATWVDAANIDLKSFDPAYYKKSLKGGLDAVKQTIVSLVDKGVWVEVTTLVIPGINDSKEELQAMAAFLSKECGSDLPWHLSAFHPDYKMLQTECTPTQTLHKARDIGQKAGLKYIYLGNIAEDAPTLCSSCGTVLINRGGYHILQNRLKNGQCPICQTAIAGRW